ncbi:hypothetical protein Goari_026570 [Gossypium aridum]|uniref:RNase H type-1 domain-containing protein n=1 Tax=Gossypium aridum TaxID=34290 RepID=A0A7J8XCH9_GOSAI|nr:hypothetical protein [Gossypium aridum]
MSFIVGQSTTRNWVILNTDGTILMGSVFYVELWSILDGPNLIERRGHDNVIIQSDSFEAVRAIQDSVSIILNYVLIRRIQRLLSHKGWWLLRHMYREHNDVADALAKLAFWDK